MNKYPLDNQGVTDIVQSFMAHSQAQNELISALSLFLREAMSYIEDESDPWYSEAEQLLQGLHKRKMDFENLRFNQGNGHTAELESPYDYLTAGMPVAPAHEQKLNQVEDGFGPTMTPEELALHFGESLPKKQKKGKALNKMTLEEISDWEAKQNDSNDIYKVAARVKNLARADGQAVLTQVGESLCNTYIHVMKAYYDFAETLDRENRIRLIELTRKQESMPGNFIAALHNGVKP